MASDGGRRTPRVASLLAGDLRIEGNLSGEGELQLDCAVKGDVSVARLTVGENGSVEGSIMAEAVEIRGRVVGTVTARQVRLHATAQLIGDLTHDQLTVEPGARFEGRSLPFQGAPPALTSASSD